MVQHARPGGGDGGGDGEGEPRLPYPTRPLEVRGGFVEAYLIPEEDKEAVLEELYPYEDVPALDDVAFDLHEGKSFRVGDFLVVREAGMELLVSPYYPTSGGTVIDWMPGDDEETLAGAADEEGDEMEEDDFTDVGLEDGALPEEEDEEEEEGGEDGPGSGDPPPPPGAGPAGGPPRRHG